MRPTSRTPEQLAEDLLGRIFDELDAEEQHVLRRIASRELVGPSSDEVAAIHMTYGDRLADKVAAIGGSWAFILSFLGVLMAWIIINSRVLEAMGLHPFDAYPFIFLNLLLSMLAAIQAPVIMMSQNRQSEKDRITARHDYEVNLRTQLEIIHLHRRFDHLVEYLATRAVVADGEET
ncbi:DUF1003 domain-containing protein [Novosphingobium colocasiae]|uniref:Cyclic nucleotide-binding protein n=1 Tax=Novosphingobium colocasiae TaxID=1256513 RepID=A0A918PBD1_9SPHN|nr:DUF1003 domain-containing protein [Novosphingobium colocasiae]GGY96081.1 cyclic nucleotide-binding protein [Novosphingobium colocasiae]